MLSSELIKWGATLFITISGLMVSLNISWATKWWAYVGFLIGHIIWSVFSVIMEEWALLGMNVVFVGIDIYAILIRYNNDK